MIGCEPLHQSHRVRSVQQHLVIGAPAVEGAQQPQVFVALLGGGEVEQPQPVVEGERIDAERALVGGLRGVGLVTHGSYGLSCSGWYTLSRLVRVRLDTTGIRTSVPHPDRRG